MKSYSEELVRKNLKTQILHVVDMIYEKPYNIEDYMIEYLKDIRLLIEKEDINSLIIRLSRISCIAGIVAALPRRK